MTPLTLELTDAFLYIADFEEDSISGVVITDDKVVFKDFSPARLLDYSVCVKNQSIVWADSLAKTLAVSSQPNGQTSLVLAVADRLNWNDSNAGGLFWGNA